MTADQPAPTIYTVAERAGVSVATVSRVLQGSQATSDATRERVLAAVAELGYAPLRRSRGRAVTHGVVVPSLAGRRHSDLLLGMALDDPDAPTVAEARMVLSCDGMAADEIDDAVAEFAERVDGLVACESTISDSAVGRLAERLPVVLVGRQPLPGCDCLVVDYQRPTDRLVAGLVAMGLTRVLLVGDPDAGEALAERHAAWTRALAAHGLTEVGAPLAVSWDEAGADAALPVLLDRLGEVDVVIGASDELALRLMHVFVWRQVKVPEDLAVVGWGGLPAADYVVPRLTTVRDPARDLGRLATARLRARLGGAPVAEPSVLRPEVIWRESTGRPDR